MNIKVPVGGSKGWHKALPGCMQIACSESDRADVSVSALQWQRLVTSSGQLQLHQWRLTYQSSLWLIDRHPPTLPREERHWLRAAGELFISFWVWPRPTVSSSHTQTGRAESFIREITVQSNLGGEYLADLLCSQLRLAMFLWAVYFNI